MKKPVLAVLKKLKFLPAPIYLKFFYEYYTGKKLNLDKPVEFNEKIQWLKAYYHPDILTKLVDKYSVRAYVEQKIGASYLNELIAVYDKASAVDFDDLPDQFVLKGVHGFHFNLIVPDKSKLNRMKGRFLMHKWMMKNQHYRGGLEWAYKNVPPRLIVEKYLEEMGKDVINDYKFFCFNGKPKFVQVDMERGTKDYRRFYDMDWREMAFLQKNRGRAFEGEMAPPETFAEMKTVAKKLADRFPFVRVDLYSIHGKVIFGEMTFYPGDGIIDFKPEKYNRILGEHIELPKIPPGQKVIKTI